MQLRNIYPYVAAFITLCLWATSFIGIRVALDSWTPGGLAFIRYIVASISLICLIPFLDIGDRIKLNLSDIGMFSTFGLLGVVGYHVGLNIGEKTVTAGTASFIVSQIPLVTLMLNTLFFREKITARGALGLVLGVSGTGIILVGESGELSIQFGVLWIIIAIISESLYFILQKKAFGRFTPFGVNLYTTLFATFLLSPFVFNLSVPDAHIGTTEIAIVAYLGIFPAAFAYLLWSYAIKELGAARTAATLYALPFVTIVAGVVLIDELPSQYAIFGGLVALFGAYLSSRTKQ